jgi:hypothetical protein
MRNLADGFGSDELLITNDICCSWVDGRPFFGTENTKFALSPFPKKKSFSSMSSIPKETKSRCGTRVPCQIPATVTCLDRGQPFSEPCQVVLVNPQGCAARVCRSVEIGVAVQLEGLAVKTPVAARVVNCISLSSFENLWLLGLALDRPGNVWGIVTPPEDWARDETEL